MFREFVRSKLDGNTGLLLAATLDIARVHRGDVTLMKIGSKGTRFCGEHAVS